MARRATPKICKTCGKDGLRWTSYVNRYGRKSYQLADWHTGELHNGPGANPDHCIPGKYQAKTVKSDDSALKAEIERLKTEIERLKTDPIGQVMAITIDDGPEISVSDKHYEFPTLAKLVSNGFNVWLTGPAGSGKTSACRQIAEALDLDFRFISVCLQTDKCDILGYKDLQGLMQVSEFRHCWQNGGVFLLDEADKGSPNTLAVLQAAADADHCAFADGIIDKHPNFRLVASANTYGNGADQIYVGSIQLDGGFLDRFVVLPWDYDQNLERQVAQDDAWTEKVQRYRKRAEDLGAQVVISPRASIRGAKLRRLGFSDDEVENLAIFNSMSASDRASIRGF